MIVITICIIMITGLLYILRYFSSSSEVSIYSQIYITFIPLSIITSDKLVMSCENSKIFTYAFCKSGALQQRTSMVPQLLPSRRASVIISQVHIYNTINYDRSTYSQRNIIYTVVGVCHIRIF
jgi:Ni,Fe-hydrogenase I cytochrome b subunit